ncbi:Subtilase family protein isoform 3 [Hibiscus syriacus]|uniref:Subtilase family protein isoform 3 n=1 Tax=Hibiscus syriacus TaxID=106335 RepID=A0A6A2XJS1_HIBSY|nr:Subtilase family protein isoform 3 [Hibiscus syriacus]
MGNFHCLYLVLLPLCFGFLVYTESREDSGSDAITAVYIVTLKQAPAAHRFEEQLRRRGHHHRHNHHRFHNDSSSGRLNRFHKPRNNSISHPSSGSYISRVHDSLLRRALRGEKYLKLYSYQYLVNGFAVFITPEQANKLSRRREVANIVLDFSVRIATTHTPQFLGLPKGAWTQGGEFETAGEGIVIGLIDTGIDPTHPSFADDASENSYPVPAHFSSVCEVTREFPSGSCDRKLVGARHFAASAITRGIFNSSEDYASPFDGDGHGTHTASVAAGNHGIPVVVAGHHFGNASGMAPRSHIAVYKALYKSFGGFAADVVAGIDQAAQDGVDVISLSTTPNRRPPGMATFFNPIDMALLSGVKAGIFVVQAGNTGPSPKSMSSFSPWIFTVGAASHDRAYSNSIILGNNAIETAKNLSAAGVVFYMDPFRTCEDSFLDDADIMKPNFIAPGNMIWAAWSSLGTDSVEFQGESFAMMSGTSMAAPHIAGLAALIKQKFPHFSPAAIASALSTTAMLYDNRGGPIMAQRAYANPDVNQPPATPFDMGSGFVNATSALLILSKTVERTVSNIAGNETYGISWSAPYGVSVKVTPTQFFIGRGEKQVLTILFNATMNHSVASFGRIGLFGDQGHKLNIPLSVIVKFSYNATSS